jgi:hypothetical protein
MSFLTRIAMRAGIPGVAAAEPILVPKDRGIQRPQGVSRQEVEPEEEEVQTLRRQADTGNDEEELETLRRQAEPEEESEEAARALMVPPASEEEGLEAQAARRAAAGAPEEEEEAQPARRVAPMADRAAQAIPRMAPTEDEEDTAASSRIDRVAAEQEEEEAQPVRRVEQDEENGQPARPLLRSAVTWRAVRRAPAPGPEELGPATSPAPPIVSDEPEFSDLRALGETPPMSAPSPPAAPIPTAHGPDHAGSAGEAPMPALPPQSFAEAPAGPSTVRFERPQVVIDRVDVLIHETMPPARAPESDKRRSRSFRARYLRRL